MSPRRRFFLLFLLLSALAQAAEIPDLSIEPVALRDFSGKRVLFLRGHFTRGDWRLNWQGNAVKVNPDGSFLLSVQAGDKDDVTVQLQAIGPRHRVQNGQYDFYFPRSKQFKEPELDAQWKARVEEAAQSEKRELASQETSTSARVSTGNASHWYLHAGLDAFGAFQGNGGGNCVSAEPSWQPTVNLSSKWALRGQFGFTMLRANNSSVTFFAAADAQAFARWSFYDAFSAEAGGGSETWISHGGTHPIISGNFLYQRSAGVPYLTAWVAGYSAFLYSPTVHFARLGAQFAF